MQYKILTLILVTFMISYCPAGKLFRGIVATQSTADSTHRVQLKKPSDKWVAVDKGKHFLGNLMSTVFLFEVQKRGFLMPRHISKFVAVGFSLNLSIGKEIWDSRRPRNHFCWKDLTADIAGIAAGIVIINQSY